MKTQGDSHRLAGALAREQVWQAAREHGDGWLDTAMTSMRDQEVQEARFELSLVAPAAVVDQADDASIRFSQWRDIVAAGFQQDDEAFEQATPIMGWIVLLDFVLAG